MKMQGHRLQDFCVCSTREETSSFCIPAQYINKEQIKHMISVGYLTLFPSNNDQHANTYCCSYSYLFFTMDEPNFITQEQQNYKS
jgi:hypothetical protein